EADEWIARDLDGAEQALGPLGEQQQARGGRATLADLCLGDLQVRKAGGAGLEQLLRRRSLTACIGRTRGAGLAARGSDETQGGQSGPSAERSRHPGSLAHRSPRRRAALESLARTGLRGSYLVANEKSRAGITPDAREDHQRTATSPPARCWRPRP